MPIYDHTCAHGHAFEARVSSFGSPAPPCPQCGAEATRNEISKPSITGDNIAQTSLRFKFNYSEP